jgi:hypothetical protein
MLPTGFDTRKRSCELSRVGLGINALRDFCGTSSAQLCFVVPAATDTPSQVIEIINPWIPWWHS